MEKRTSGNVEKENEYTMKILYISHLNTNIASGLNWSVPASVSAQSKIDEVLWVNMTDVVMPHWKQVDAYHNVTEYGGKLNTLDSLPDPFKRPDIVVFEGFYNMEDVRIARMLRKQKIPYMVIPRGSLTNEALHNHAWLKKWFAHKLFFDSFVKQAIAIQYLTRKEADDSINRFHTPYFIIPNGFNIPKERKCEFSKEGVRAVFIGRLDIFHKGLDLLFDAVSEIKDKLITLNFHLDIYGPYRDDYEKIRNIIKERNISSIVSLCGGVDGEAKKDALLNSDLFVMTSRFEGHPMGLIEALAYGLPCFVTPGSNMLEEIKSFDAGWTCGLSVESIKEILEKAVREKHNYEKKGKNAQMLAQQYNWSDIAFRFHQEVKSMVDNLYK